MGAIEEELKQLIIEQKNADASVEAAVATLARSQQGLNDARARQSDVMQLLAPLQQFVTNVENSMLAVENQREAAARELEEAKKLREDLFKTVSDEIDVETLKALDSAEAKVRESEEAIRALAQKVQETGAGRTAAETDADAAEERMRELSVELANLPNQIQSARQRVAALVSSARGSFAAGETGETFLALRGLQIQSDELAKIAAEDIQKRLLEAIESERAKARVAQQKVADQTAILAKLSEDLSALDKELQTRRQAAKDARAALAAAGQPA